MSPLVVAASVTGAAHLRTCRGLEDRWASSAAGPGRVALAIADGMGSAPRAAEGAQTAVDAAVAAAASMLMHPASCDIDVVARAMPAYARAALEGLAAPLSDLACTFIGVVASGLSVCAAHVGDGAVVAHANGAYVVLSAPAPSEYVNETDSITSDGWRDRVRVSEVLENVDAVAAFTDGCQHAVMSAGCEPHARFLDPLFDYVREAATGASDELASLLAGAKLSEHSDDDKTLALILL